MDFGFEDSGRHHGGPGGSAGTITATVPSSPVSAIQGTAAPITGISITDSNASASVTAVVSDLGGKLTASATGAGDIIAGSGTNRLVIAGTLSQVNADLGTLSYTATTGFSDRISIGLLDSSGAHGGQSIGVTVTPVPTVNTPSQAISISATQSTSLAGDIRLSDPVSAKAGTAVTVNVSASNGTLSASLGNGGAGSTITGSGTNSLTISGTVAQANSDLRTLAYQPNSGTTSDTITTTLADPTNGNATGTLAVSAGPVANAPPGLTVEQGNPTHVAGLSVSDNSGSASTETVTANLTDSNGILSANTATWNGGGAVTGSGTNNVTISGTLAQVNADLGTLTFTSGTAGSDTLAMAVTTNAGGSANASTSVDVVNLPAGVPAQLLVQYAAGFGDGGHGFGGFSFAPPLPPLLLAGHHHR